MTAIRGNKSPLTSVKWRNRVQESSPWTEGPKTMYLAYNLADKELTPAKTGWLLLPTPRTTSHLLENQQWTM